MKNYKKVYKELIKTLKEELVCLKKYSKDLNDREQLVDKIENQGEIYLLNWILKDYIPELEGKKWSNLFLNKLEFEEWKKEINE